MLSVDTQKKELVGAFKNAGRTWRQQPLEVWVTDFLQDAWGKAMPYGSYAITRKAGYVVVGRTHETSVLAIAVMRSWGLVVGRPVHPDAQALLLEADRGGANGNRCWLWQIGLQALADEFGLTMTVAHYPAGASKWNPIEQRLFSQISDKWVGQPLHSYETVLKFMRTPQTATGLRCRTRLDTTAYKTGLKATTQDQAQINFKPQCTRPQYNYTIRPRACLKKK